LIVHSGIRGVADILKNNTYEMAVGEGTTPAWVDNTTLQSEVKRLDVVPSLISTNIVNDTLLFDAVMTVDAAYDLSEIGIFKKEPSGFLLCRIVITPIPISANRPIPIKIRMPITK